MSIDSVRNAPGVPRSAAREPEARARPGLVGPVLANLGVAGLVLALFGVAVEVLAIAVGTAGQWTVATVLAWVVIGVLTSAFVVGVVAILARRARRCGTAAAVVSLIAHPLILVGLFAALGGTR